MQPAQVPSGYGQEPPAWQAADSTRAVAEKQLVEIAKAIGARARILILDEPTRGVDVGAREEIFAIIGRLVESGMAVLLISSDLDEVIRISHRIAIYRDGQILGTVPAGQTNLEQIMSQLTGVRA